MNKINWGSWKTSTAGIIGACVFVFIALKVWNSYLTGEPVDIDLIISGGVALATTINGLFGRDNNVSSQDVGIR